MERRNKIIFVGQENVHNAFVQMKEYDFQEPITTLAEFKEEISKDKEHSKISRDESSVIIFFSRLYPSNEREFAELVAFYAPYALVAVLIPEQDMNLKPRIESLINAQKKENARKRPGSYDPATPTYFLSYDSPIVDLRQAMSDFVADPAIGVDIKSNVVDMLPKHLRNTLSIEAEFEEVEEEIKKMYGDEDEIVIPESTSEEDGKVIAVTSSKGGAGKSTVSMLLATYLAKSSRISEEKGIERKKLKICVVDLDTRDGQLGFLEGRLQPTIYNIISATDFAREKIPSEEAVKKGIYSSAGVEADFIFAPRRGRHAIKIKPMNYAALIHKLKSMYDYVILDTSVIYLDPLLEKVAYPMADQIVYVTNMVVTSVMGMARWIKETTDPIEKGGSGINKDKIGIVINKAIKNSGMELRRIEQSALGLPIISIVPDKAKTIIYKSNVTSLDEAIYESSLNKAFKTLANQIVRDEYKLSDIPISARK